MRSKLAPLLFASALGVLASGCGDGDTTTDTASSAVSDTPTTAGVSPATGGERATADGSWVLDAAASSLTDVGEAVITLTIEVDAAHGSAGCNSYNGGVTIEGTSVTLGEIAMSQMMCEDAVMAAETEYVAALTAVDTAHATEDLLVLTGPDGTTLSFTTIDPSAEIVGEWSIVNYATADAIIGPVDPSEPSITFVEDGTLSLNTDCNTIASSWTLDGDALTIEPPASTMIACDVVGVMDQEADLLAAIENSATVEIAPGQLTILGPDGNILIIATQDD